MTSELSSPTRLALTNAQAMLWASQRLNPEAPMYNMAFLFTIDGSIDEARFKTAFGRLVEEADALRTTVGDVDGVPFQEVSASFPFVVPVIDLSEERDPAAAATEWARERCRVPLDIGQQTFDAALLRLAADRYGWYFNQHHIVTDAWSSALLFERMDQLYTSRQSDDDVTVHPLPSYAEYVAYERSLVDTDRGDGFEPESAKNRLRLYGHDTVDVESTANERTTIEVTQARSDALRRLSRTPGIQALTPDLSMFELLSTAFFAFLHRASGDNTITIGAPVHNRSTAVFRQVVGLLMEVYPLGVEVTEDDTFASLHGRVRTAAAAFLHSARPGRSDTAQNREISVVMNYIRAEFASFAGMPVAADWLHPDSVDALHQLRLQVYDFSDSGRFTLSFDTSTDVFDEATRLAIPVHFLNIVDAMTDDFDQPIAEIGLLSQSQSSEINEVVNGGAVEAGPIDDVVAQILEQVRTRPTSVAIDDNGREWTYEELDRTTRAIASSIEAGSVVGVALPRSAEAVLSMVAVLRAGAAYVPIDPKWPASRLAHVTNDAGCTFVVSEDGRAFEVPSISFRDLASGKEAQDSPIDATDLAYVLYTSGSTGLPKGVMVEHGAFGNYITWAKGFYDRGRGLTFPLFTPLTFDLTVTSIFVPLASGGTIRVYEESDQRADISVIDVFADDAVDIVKLTPSHLALVADGSPIDSRIGQLILGGEDLQAPVARKILRRLGGDVLIHNEYGPTEATVGCIVHTFDPAADTAASVPIGRPISGMRAHVLDPVGHRVPFGVPGELWISGEGLARGYVGQPEMTDARFRPLPRVDEVRGYRTGDVGRIRQDGVVEYLGRQDDQVKVHGVRVELGEVEVAVASHPGVIASAAQIWTDDTKSLDADLVHCVRCGLGSDYPGISFDHDRVCTQCRGFDEYAERARVYFRPEDQLGSILRSRTTSESKYDCLALLSGGKDSTYVLCRLADMGLRVLAFTLDNGYTSEQAKGNIQRVVDELGVDHVFASTPAMNEIFVDSLQRHANVCQGCFKTIYTLSMQTALEHEIPFIVTGLSRGQFFETRLTDELFTEMTVTAEQIDANVLEARRAYHQIDDAVRRSLDVSMFDDDDVFERVQYVDFYRYIDVDLDELYSYLDERVPWTRPTDTGRSTNCLINDVGIYYHRKNRGYHNYALPYSWDVRVGHKTRDEALAELDDDIDIAEVARILEEIGFPDEVVGAESTKRLISYYVSPVDIPLPELRTHVAASLPHQIVPTQFVRLDTIPLTANGKVDRSALPSPDHQRPDVGNVFVAAHTDNERLLAGIWQDVLGIETIGVKDNYFDLGGDSITAVQIIARAHRSGLPVTMHQLFDKLTVESLATAIETPQPADSEAVAGPIGMTPVQHWFFTEAPDPSHLHQVVRITTPADTDSAKLEASLNLLVSHHEALRQSFRREGSQWVTSVDDEPRPVRFEVVETDDPRSPNHLSSLTGPFDLANPPLMRAKLLNVQGGPSELVLVAHHLVVDAVSWSHIADDLGYIYGERSHGRPGDLPPVMTTIGRWSAALANSAATCDPSPWEKIAAAETRRLPFVDPTKDLAFARSDIDESMTEALTTNASTWRIGIDELLLASLSMTLANLQSTSTIRLFIEGHGRASDTASMDVTRTMGWFTDLYPSVLELPETDNLVASALEVRDQLRHESDSKAAYGVLRYLHPDAAVNNAVSIDTQQHVVFNYLGRVQTMGSGGSEFSLAAPIALSRPHTSPTLFGVEVTAYIDDGRLVVDWTANADKSDLAEAAAAMTATIRSIIDAFGSDFSSRHARADVSYTDLGDDALQKLAAALEASDGGRG